MPWQFTDDKEARGEPWSPIPGRDESLQIFSYLQQILSSNYCSFFKKTNALLDVSGLTNTLLITAIILVMCLTSVTSFAECPRTSVLANTRWSFIICQSLKPFLLHLIISYLAFSRFVIAIRFVSLFFVVYFFFFLLGIFTFLLEYSFILVIR